MHVTHVLKQAWDAVRASGVPEELHDTALKEAVRLLSGEGAEKSLEMQSAEVDRKRSIGEQHTVGSSGLHATPAAKFAEESGLGQHKIDTVFYFTDDEVHLNGPARKLGSAKAQQMRTVAIALTAAYNYAFDVQSLSIEKVRAECERLKCYDKGNFNTVTGKITALNYTGPARDKTLRVKADGNEALAKVIDDVLGVKSPE